MDVRHNRAHRAPPALTSAAGLLAGLLLLSSSAAWGGPQQGLGLSAGIVHHDYRLAQDVGPPLEFTGTGLGVVGDAQFVRDSVWSIVPLLQVSLERSTDMFAGPDATRGAVLAFSGTLQLRRWWGDFFAGGHAGIYSAFFRSHSGQIFRRHSPGVGCGLGWEGETGRTALLGLDYEDPFVSGSRRVSLRLQFGYRWR